MSDTLYAKKEAQYEANRLKISKENEKNRRAIEKKRKEKEAKKEKDRIKKAKVLYHSVKRGDTLYSIARKYGTTVDKICKMNKMKSTDILDLGRKLKVK
jgi:LysM repeat protein